MGNGKLEREKLKKERLGEVKYNNRGEKMTIIKYNNYENITVQFDNGLKVFNANYGNFTRGTIMNPINKSEGRLGEVNFNKWGDKMTITEYNTANNIIVEFEDKSTVKTVYTKFKDGCVKKPVNRLGEVGYNISGDKMTIIKYDNFRNIIVKFHNGLIRKTTYGDFSRGNVKNPVNTNEYQKQKRLGEINYNNSNNKMTIIEYNNALDIKVQFENGFIAETRYECFTNGEVKSPYDKTVYGVGYFGEGKFKANVNNKSTQEYSVWHSMMQRCYSEESFKIKPTYIDCTVDEKWHNFQTFASWYQNNYYVIDNEVMEIDKDILYKGNRVYSDSNCCIVPHNINTLFIKSDATRGDFPIGVHYDKTTNKYIACCNNGKGKNICLGYFEDEIKGFNTYKQYKENIIKKVAEEYKNKIPLQVYNTMMSWKVEITD